MKKMKNRFNGKSLEDYSKWRKERDEEMFYGTKGKENIEGLEDFFKDSNKIGTH